MVSLGSGLDHNDRIERLGSLCRNFHRWQEKIKREFDPKLLSDPSSYMVYRNKLMKATESNPGQEKDDHEEEPFVNR